MRTLLFVSAFATTALTAQELVRGPYLQTPTDNSIVVMWRTDVVTTTTLWYGAAPDALTEQLTIPGTRRDHSVTIGGLEPYTTYYYAVGHGNTPLAGGNEQYRFRTHPVPGTEQPVRAWAIGDFGKGNAGQVAVKESYMAYPGSADTDVWIWLGDNAYQDGKDHEYQNKVFGLEGFSDIFNWLPFYPTPGNHDYNEVWRVSTFLGLPYSNIPLQNHQGPYFDIVDVPEQGEAGGHPSQLEVFYSFDHGNVHFLSLNSEVYDFLQTGNGINQMLAWVQQDLAQNTLPWTIAYFHQPPYSKGSHNSDDLYELVMKAMRDQVVPVLESWDVDLVVCGHSHVFERSHLIHGHYGYSGSWDPATMLKDGNGGNFDAGNAYQKDNDPTTADGTVYVVCGNSGSSSSDGSLNHPVMVAVDGGSQAYGSFVIDVYRNRLDGRYLRADGVVADHFTILKRNLALETPTDQTLCPGTEATLQAAWSGGSNEVTFLWEPGGAQGPVITVEPEVTTTYSLTVTDALTGQVLSTTVTVNVTQLPDPVVQLVGDSLVVAEGYTYQWYLDGVAISGANAHFIVLEDYGTYSVAIAAGDCQVLSPPWFHASTGTGDTGRETLRLFPNPTGDRATLVLAQACQRCTVRVIDAQGAVVRSARVNGNTLEIDLGDQPAGGYQVVLEHPDGRVQRGTLVKQ
jgi:hypothetical protein